LAKQKQPPKGKTIPLITKKRPLALRFWPLARFKIKTKNQNHTADYADKRGWGKAAFGPFGFLAKFKIKGQKQKQPIPRITPIEEKRPLALGFWLKSKPKSKSNLTADFADRRGFAQIFGSCIFDLFRLKFAIDRLDS
jgi:hypothetical protein